MKKSQLMNRNHYLRLLTVIFTLSIFVAPKTYAVSDCRLVVDKIIRVFSLGFLGKPISLQGIKTKRIVWGPHSIKNVFTHFLGVFVGGGGLMGVSWFGHPYGDVTINGGENFIDVKITPRYGQKFIKNEKIREMLDKVENLRVYTSNGSFSSLEKINFESRKAGDELHLNLSNKDKLPVSDFREKVEQLLTIAFE